MEFSLSWSLCLVISSPLVSWAYGYFQVGRLLGLAVLSQVVALGPCTFHRSSLSLKAASLLNIASITAM